MKGMFILTQEDLRLLDMDIKFFQDKNLHISRNNKQRNSLLKIWKKPSGK